MEEGVRDRRWGWRIAVFALVFLLLQTGYGAARGSWLERAVIDTATVRTAAALIGGYAPQIGARAEGPRLVAPGGSINVLNGCEGTDILFLLCAAMLAAPIAWRHRLLGLALGVPLVFVLNQARLLALFHAFRTDPEWFAWLHGSVGPLILVLAVGLFFAAWVRRWATEPPSPPLASSGR